MKIDKKSKDFTKYNLFSCKNIKLFMWSYMKVQNQNVNSYHYKITQDVVY